MLGERSVTDSRRSPWHRYRTLPTMRTMRRSAYSLLRMTTAVADVGDTCRALIRRSLAWARAAGIRFDRGWTGLLAHIPRSHAGFAHSVQALHALVELVDLRLIPPGAVVVLEHVYAPSSAQRTSLGASLKEVLERGIILVTLDDQERHSHERHLHDPRALHRSLKVAFQYGEARERRSLGTRKGLRNRCKNDLTLASTRKCPTWLRFEGEGKRFVHREPIASAILSAVKSVREGHDLGAVAHRFNSEGVPSPISTRRWTAGTLHAILQHPFLTGTSCIQEARNESYPSQKHRTPPSYPPLITGVEFEAVKARLSQLMPHAHHPTHRFAHQWLAFAGLVRCATCGHPLSRSRVVLTRHAVVTCAKCLPRQSIASPWKMPIFLECLQSGLSQYRVAGQMPKEVQALHTLLEEWGGERTRPVERKLMDCRRLVMSVIRALTLEVHLPADLFLQRDRLPAMVVNTTAGHRIQIHPTTGSRWTTPDQVCRLLVEGKHLAVSS